MKLPARAVLLDRLSLAGMALGVALVLQPWWSAGFRLGFALTGASIIVQIVAAHLPREVPR